MCTNIKEYLIKTNILLIKIEKYFQNQRGVFDRLRGGG